MIVSEILTHSTIWVNLGDILLSEMGQTRKDRYCVIPASAQTESGLGAARKKGELFNGHRVSIWDKKVLEMDSGDSCTTS